MRIALTGGAYQAKSLIANAQRCINLYPEKNPGDSPAPFTYYQTPGISGPLIEGIGNQYPSRCTYTASNGALYFVRGNEVNYVNSSLVATVIGHITPGTNTVSIADNGIVAILVDNTTNGYVIDLKTNSFGAIVDASFTGATRVDYLDTYFLFNKISTNQWYISLSNVDFGMLTTGTAFDPLDIASKAGYPDNIVSLIVMHLEVWLVGTQTSEIWFNSGAADFTFQIMPGVFIEHGCIAPYSLAKQDLSVYWLSQDKQGQGIVIKGNNYSAHRISTNAMENEFSKYSTLADAIGFTYQQEGHTFYVLTFPTADKTWVFDELTGEWHQRVSLNSAKVSISSEFTLDGNYHQVIYNCCTNAYNKVVAGEIAFGGLYELDLDSQLDLNDTPIPRVRSFPHMIEDSNRVVYTSFTADMEVGTNESGEESLVALRWSDDRGKTFGNYVYQSLGALGEYLTSIQWGRLGMARDRVFELSWSTPTETALNGAFIDVLPSKT